MWRTAGGDQSRTRWVGERWALIWRCIVQKFGGTSVGSIERIEQVADKVARFREGHASWSSSPR
jgi:hypothetical protein